MREGVRAQDGAAFNAITPGALFRCEQMERTFRTPGGSAVVLIKFARPEQ